MSDVKEGKRETNELHPSDDLFMIRPFERIIDTIIYAVIFLEFLDVNSVGHG